jgi:hypothetical protein
VSAGEAVSIMGAVGVGLTLDAIFHRRFDSVDCMGPIILISVVAGMVFP